MKKYFISSDIHAYYDEYMTALNAAGFEKHNSEHMLIICGDIFDRGEKPLNILSFFDEMSKDGRLIFIRGNHEDLLMDLVWKNECRPTIYDYTNQTVKTIEDITGIVVRPLQVIEIRERLKNAGVFRLIDSSMDYYETKNHIFVHGWIPNIDMGDLYDPNWRNASRNRWKEARWLNGMKEANAGVREPNKTIVCGHWHASYGNSRKKYPDALDREYPALEFSDMELFKPYYGDGIIAIDACTAYTGYCNVITMNEDEI